MPSTATSRLEGLTTSVAIKSPCVAATTANITLSGAQTVNGVACVDGDRVLVKDQTDSTENGIYVVRTTAWERAKDFDGARDVVQGTNVLVLSADGTGADTWYRVTTADPVIGTSAIDFAASVFGDATSVSFIQSGTGAVTRTAQAKMRDVICVLDFGATGDGSTDDTTAFSNALTAASGKALYVPDPSTGYRITSTLTVPDNTTIYGDGKSSTRIFLDAATTLMTLGAGATLDRLYLDGNFKAGIGVNMTGTNGQQTIAHCKITDFDIGTGGGCINFAATTAGTGFRCIDVLSYQANGTSGSGKYAVWNQDASESNAQPRHFFGFESGGKCSFSLGGCNSWYVLGGFISDIAFSTNSRVFTMTGARWASPLSTITIDGGQHCIANCDVYSSLILASGCGGCVIGPNAYNNSVPDDNSGVGTNLIYHLDEAYTPTLGSSGTAPVIGNGTITGYFNRQGNVVNVTVQIVMGTTTTLGTGILNVSLPANYPCSYPIPQEGGVGRGLDSSVPDYYYCYMEMAANPTYAEMRREAVVASGTQAGFTATYPVTWATGDTFNLSFSYIVGV